MRLLVLLQAAACAAAFAADSRPVNLPFKDISGKSVHLSDVRGKPVVLNFWATWCVPCRAEMPLFIEAAKEFGEKGIVFLAVSLDDKQTRPKIPAFVEEFKIPFTIWTGGSTMDLQDLKLGEALPATAFLDPKGRIVARVIGQITRDELRARLEYLTNPAAAAAPEPVVRHVN